MKKNQRNKISYKTGDVLLFKESEFTAERAKQICKMLGKPGIMLRDFSDFSSISFKHLKDILKKQTHVTS